MKRKGIRSKVCTVTPVILPKVQVAARLHLKHAYTLDPTKSEWADYVAVQA